MSEEVTWFVIFVNHSFTAKINIFAEVNQP